MRKGFVGLLVVALLLVAGQAGAQPPNPNNGTGDPLGLIASGAIQPFWALGGNVTVVEITSPVGDNSNLHGVFFDANCARDFSIPIPLTENDVFLLNVSNLVNYSGLLVIAGTENQLTLVPAKNPFHVRAQWINLGADWIREVDPIQVQHAERPATTYNVLRSAASFVAPLEDAVFHTEIYLNCPSPAVLNEVRPELGFPGPQPQVAFAFTKASARIFGVIYDGDEEPLRNIQVPCACSSMFPVLDINPVYGDPGEGFLFYTELVTYAGPPFVEGQVINPATFTGYRGITVTFGGIPGGTLDDFARLNNGSAFSYQSGRASPGLR